MPRPLYPVYLPHTFTPTPPHPHLAFPLLLPAYRCTHTHTRALGRHFCTFGANFYTHVHPARFHTHTHTRAALRAARTRVFARARVGAGPHTRREGRTKGWRRAPALRWHLATLLSSLHIWDVSLTTCWRSMSRLAPSYEHNNLYPPVCGSYRDVTFIGRMVR